MSKIGSALQDHNQHGAIDCCVQIGQNTSSKSYIGVQAGHFESQDEFQPDSKCMHAWYCHVLTIVVVSWEALHMELAQTHNIINNYYYD